MIRRCVGIVAVALGLLALVAPAAGASTISRPTSYVFTGPNALADCRAMGQWEVANNGWDGFGCKPDPTVGPTAERLWTVINTS